MFADRYRRPNALQRAINSLMKVGVETCSNDRTHFVGAL
jgi:hypothetical protein